MEYFTWHLYIMSGMYIIAGLFHFIRPEMYLRIMPRYLPAHLSLVYLSGLLEIVLGILLLFKTYKDWAIYGIILMLLIFLVVHFYMLSSKKASAGIPRWILLLRLPLQFVLIWWAYFYLQF